jgi:hypothetical protein
MRSGRGWRRAPRLSGVEVAIIGVAGVVIGTLLGAFVAARNQVKAEVREKRREMYLEWLLFIDRIPADTLDAIINKRADEFVRDFRRRLGDITTEIDIFGSRRVAEKWDGLRSILATEKYDDKIKEWVDEAPAEQKRFDLAFEAVWRSYTEMHRRALAQAMRKDIGTWQRGGDTKELKPNS